MNLALMFVNISCKTTTKILSSDETLVILRGAVRISKTNYELGYLRLARRSDIHEIQIRQRYMHQLS